MNQPPPTHGQQLLLCLALLGGVVIFALVVAAQQQLGGGKGLAAEPIAVLDQVSIATGAATLAGALLLRAFLRARAESRQGDERTMARFLSTLAPLALLEAGMFTGVITWMLNGNAVPSLVVTCPLLAVALAIVPFSPPPD